MRRFFFLFIFLVVVGLVCQNGFAEETSSASAASETSTEAPGESAAPSEEPPLQAEKPNVIADIEVRGNQIVSTNTILSKVESKKGMLLTQEKINEDIKRLYATGFFKDIRIEVEEEVDGYRLIFFVEEKPIIRQIVLEGFTVFKENKLRDALKLIEGQILDRRAVKEGVIAIRKLYADKGYRFVDVQSEIDVDVGRREATILIRITEGEKFRIKDIKFEGVKAFKHQRLRKLMKTKKKKLFSSGVFKESNFQKDLERIRLFYQQEGYLDVKVEPQFDYDRAEQRIFITIVVQEGRQYVTGEIEIEGNRLFPQSEIWQELEMLPGQTYSQFYLFKDIERIRDYYYEQGYMDARIIPDIQLNRETGKVDVKYQITEGDLFFVEKVIIRGNTKTKDIVIRRELRIRPGERFDGKKINKSKQRLENLGYFEDVTFDTEPTPSAQNRKNIIFRVKEKRTGELSFGGGVSSVDKFLGFAEISQRNFDLWNWPRFTGGGQSLSIKARIGSISQDFNISFVEPYLFNRPISFGVDIFNVFRDDENVDFEQMRRGFGLTFSRMFRDVFRLGTGYTLERVELDDISDDAAQIVRDFEGVNWLSRVKFFGSYDTRDNVFFPGRGVLISASTDIVGGFLGGDQSFYVAQASFTKYWRFFRKHLFEFRVRLGTADAFGDSETVPVFDRFYAGGLGTVRGFDYRRVGPIEGGDAVGGETLAVANVEYTFPVPLLENFRGAFFIDVGQVNADSWKVDAGDFAVSIGPGIKIKTPIGPMAFYYGYPIANADEDDSNGKFEFSLSRGF